MRRDDNAYLLDILIEAKRIKEFTANLTRESFKLSKLHQHAVTRALEIIGEAAQNISDKTRNAHPEIPLRKMNGMRNKIIHAYFQVDLEVVWDTVIHDVPKLIEQIEPLVPKE